MFALLANKFGIGADIEAAQRKNPYAFDTLCLLMDGCPLVMEAVVRTLRERDIAQVVASFEGGQDVFGASMRGCVEAPLAGSPTDVLTVLSLLAPFSSAVNIAFVDNYADLLRGERVVPISLADSLKRVLFANLPTVGLAQTAEVPIGESGRGVTNVRVHPALQFVYRGKLLQIASFTGDGPGYPMVWQCFEHLYANQVAPTYRMWIKGTLDAVPDGELLEVIMVVPCTCVY
jgi:hypothetical protein